MSVLITFDWNASQGRSDMNTYYITVFLGPQLQSNSWIVRYPPLNLSLNLNNYTNITVVIRDENSFCGISSDPFILHFACKIYRKWDITLNSS